MVGSGKVGIAMWAGSRSWKVSNVTLEFSSLPSHDWISLRTFK